jgi:ABC-type phosphate transport system substrate-binding protein
VRKLTKTLLAGGVAAAAVSALLAGTASADPPAGVTPAHSDIVGVGAQTDDLLFDQFATDYDSTLAASDPHLYSYDAQGSATIPEKTGCAVNGTDPVRPNGANAGITALEANAHPTGDATDFCVDFARNTRNRAASDPSSIVFIPFAIDAVTWSADNQPGKKTHAPTDLSTTDLKAIYSCDASLLGGGKSGPVTWDEVGGTGTNAIVPVIPNSLAGTRTFFLGAIGVTTLGSCVVGQDNSVEQNEGTNPVFSGSNSADIVFPYSVAVFLAQTQFGHGAGDQGFQVLRSVDGVAPTAGKTGKLKININFPYVRYVSNVVRNASTTGRAVPKYLKKIFGTGTKGTGWICNSSVAAADIKSYGFLPAGSVCGTLQ